MFFIFIIVNIIIQNWFESFNKNIKYYNSLFIIFFENIIALYILLNFIYNISIFKSKLVIYNNYI